MWLADKVVLVIRRSRGIGRGIAITLANAGSREKKVPVTLNPAISICFNVL